MAILLSRMNDFAGKPLALTLVQQEQWVGRYEDGGLLQWSREAVAEALASGIMNGRTETELAPEAPATRAEATVMLKRCW